MGSRGMFKASGEQGILEEFREYSEVGVLEGIKIVQDDVRDNNRSPTYSNSADTAYFSFSKRYKRIERLLFYKNHRLHRNVDFKPHEVPHAHTWDTRIVGRKSHDKKNHLPLTSHEMELVQAAILYNQK